MITRLLSTSSTPPIPVLVMLLPREELPIVKNGYKRSLPATWIYKPIHQSRRYKACFEYNSQRTFLIKSVSLLALASKEVISLRTVCHLSSFQLTFSSFIRRPPGPISISKYALEQTDFNAILYAPTNLAVLGSIVVDSLPQMVHF